MRIRPSCGVLASWKSVYGVDSTLLAEAVGPLACGRCWFGTNTPCGPQKWHRVEKKGEAADICGGSRWLGCGHVPKSAFCVTAQDPTAWARRGK